MATFCAVPMKRTNEIDTIKPMRKFIENTYSNVKPEDYDTAIVEFNKLRNLMIQKSLDKHESALEILYRYYDQLCEMEKKLPISGYQIPITFKWRDAFDVDSLFSGKRTLAIMSGSYERMCVLFNIAAMQSQIAASQNIDSDDGMKVATKYFQMSCGVLGEMKDVVLSHVQQDPTPDMCPDTLNALASLMLAQAQENFYRKAFADKMKEATVAKLSYQCSELYADAMKLMQLPSIRDIFPRDWLPTVTMKQAALHALAEYSQSIVSQKNKSYGEEISRLKHANELMKTAQSRGGNAFTYRTELGRIERAMEKAVKDNDFIYHDKVPDSRELPAIGKLAMAKPIAPSKPMSSGFSDLFAKLVPLQVHYALTAFENRKSTVVNMEVGRMREATQLMNSILASLNLPAALEDMTGTNVPESIMEKAQKVKDGGGIAYLERLLSDIPALLKRNRDILDEACKNLDDEESSDTQLRQQFGERWKRTPSATLTGPMKEEAAKYRSILDRAVEADGVVKDKYMKHRAVIEILSKPQSEINSAVPSANPASSQQQSPAVSDLRRMMDEVDAIRAEREVTESEINSASFDIEKLFLAALAQDGAIEEERISTDELNRAYTGLRERVSQSIARQETLMQSIQVANTEFCNAKQSSGAAVSRETALKDLAAGYDMFTELKTNLDDGTKFYNDLTPLLVKSQSKAMDFCFARKTEKEELMADLQKTIANQPSQNPPPAPKYQTPGAPETAPQAPPRRPPPPVTAGGSATSQTDVGVTASSAPKKPVAAPRSHLSTSQQASNPLVPAPNVPSQNYPETTASAPALTGGGFDAAPASSMTQLPYPTQPPGPAYGAASGYYPPAAPVPMPMPTGYNPYMQYPQPPPYMGQPFAQQQSAGYPSQAPYPQQPYPQAPYPQQQPPYPQAYQQYPTYNTQNWR